MLPFLNPKNDKLLGALIGIARATDGNEHLITPASTSVIVDGLIAVATGLDDTARDALCLRAEEEKRNMVPDCFLCACPCGKNSDYPMENLRNAPEENRELKCNILQALVILTGQRDDAVDRFFYKALFAVGMDDWTATELLPILREAEQLAEKG